MTAMQSDRENVGLLDLNTISVDEMLRHSHAQISTERAETLIKYRDVNGPFQSWDDVKKVPGFADRLVEGLKLNFSINQQASAQQTQQHQAVSNQSQQPQSNEQQTRQTQQKT